MLFPDHFVDDVEGAGFKRFIIKPSVLYNYLLKHFSFEYDSPYGTIRVAWKVEKEQHIINGFIEKYSKDTDHARAYQTAIPRLHQ